jgi:electron-transferring-flavoprotein dehydrogenase
VERESMQYDVVIVGAGPAGLSAAIHLKQLAAKAGSDVSICVLEKGSEVGAHILSGAILEPRALDELLPDWKNRGAPLETPAGKDRFLYLTETESIQFPHPPQMNNHGNYIISLGRFCRWLAEQAEELGVEIYPGFAAAEVLYHADGSVRGVATGDMGLGPRGEKTANWQAGMELHARQTLFAEGCRGSLSKMLMEKFKLNANSDHQCYGIGIKELWEVDPAQHQPGSITHTVGWPLDGSVYGGAFLYHLENNQVAVGFVLGLDYSNPHLSPFEEFQRFKTHPAIRGVFKGGRRIAYGARALSEGGVQAQPKLTFPGGALIGDAAGFLNVPKIKGTHTAMKSGMLAAQAVFDELALTDSTGTASEIGAYPQAYRKSWLFEELWRVRNIRPSFRFGLWPGLLLAGLDTYLFRGRAPWTLHMKHADHQTLQRADLAAPITYPKPDGVLTFDRLSSVYLANTQHREEQPVHLRLRDPQLALTVNLAHYDAPETRYCPAGVYEIVSDGDTGPRLQINAQNCVHCKTCDIKDPCQNIDWSVPEGGCGPNYPNM